MTIIEAIRTWSDHLSNYVGGRGEFWEAREHISSLIDAYDALEPDWSQAPEWAQWATLFDNGKFVWWEFPPVPSLVDGQWVMMEATRRQIGRVKTAMKLPVPLGIDWRLCIWQRPEAQP